MSEVFENSGNSEYSNTLDNQIYARKRESHSEDRQSNDPSTTKELVLPGCQLGGYLFSADSFVVRDDCKESDTEPDADEEYSNGAPFAIGAEFHIHLLSAGDPASQ